MIPIRYQIVSRKFDTLAVSTDIFYLKPFTLIFFILNLHSKLMLPFSAWIRPVIIRGPQMEIIKMAMKLMVGDWLNPITSPGKPLHRH